MKKFTGLLLVVFIHAVFFQTALAQDGKTALVPLPSLDDFTRGKDGWSFGLGLGVEYESAYEGSDEFGFEVQPAGAVQWRRGDDIFFFAGEALGWRGLRSDTWLLEAILGFEEGREESDSDDGRLDGLGDTDEGIEFALQARRAFDADWRNWLDGRVVTGENGSLGIFGLGVCAVEKQLCHNGTAHSDRIAEADVDDVSPLRAESGTTAAGEPAGLAAGGSSRVLHQ